MPGELQIQPDRQFAATHLGYELEVGVRIEL
jgi:hypothetical protein